MAEDADKIVLHGACRITVGSTILGHTTPDGVSAPINGDPVHAFTGKWGPNVPAKSFNPGQGITVEFMLNETVLANLIEAFPNWARISGSGKEKVVVGVTSGKTIPAQQLVLTSFLPDETPLHDLTVFKAVPTGTPTIAYHAKNEQQWAVKFVGQINESTGLVFSYGDNSASAETDNADVTAVSPVVDEPSAPVSTNVVFTFDRELDETTVDESTVLLYEDDATPVQIDGEVTLVNNGAATLVTFNPDSNLAAAKLHLASVTAGIKDVNGLAIDGYTYKFTTAP